MIERAAAQRLVVRQQDEQDVMAKLKKLLFVDANIWLDFYRARNDAGLTLLGHVEAVSVPATPSMADHTGPIGSAEGLLGRRVPEGNCGQDQRSRLDEVASGLEF